MTKTEAFKLANSRIGALYECAPKQWGFNTWSDRHNAWWLAHGQPYQQARASRCATVAASAANLYLAAHGMAEEDADGFPLTTQLEMYAEDMEGSSRQRFDRLVRSVARSK